MARVKKVKPITSPELIKLAEGEIAIEFMEQPQLEANVREKVAEVIGNKNTRPLVDVKHALSYLKSNLGLELAVLICSADNAKFNAFMRSANPAKPSSLQARNIGAAYVIVDILLSSLPRYQVIDWLTSHSDYLYGIPAVELHKRPEDVRMAALNKITSGDS